MMIMTLAPVSWRVGISGALLIALVASAAAAFVPDWLLSLATVAAGTGMVVLGLLVLWRSGMVPLGQALYFSVGAYTVALLQHSGITADALFALIAAGAVAGLLAAAVGALLSRYRQIFFAMLSLALSMIFYGVLVQSSALGASDGLHVGPATFFGWTPGSSYYVPALFVLAWLLACSCAVALHAYLRSVNGGLTSMVAQNEVRIEYLGFSVRRLVHLNLTIAGVLAGLGGGVTAMAVGHVDPTLSFWTTSGEFVFVAILAGPSSVVGVLASALAFVLLRSTVMTLVPHAWQFLLGAALFLVIVFIPSGLGGYVVGLFKRGGVKS